MHTVDIFDTTLRDGQQGKGISFTVEDRVKIAKLLDQFGVKFIEGGWPGASPKVDDFFAQMRDVKLKNAKMVAFGSTRRASNSAEDDIFLNKIVESGVPTACIFGKTWDLHVHEALKISLEENLDIIETSVAFLRRSGLQVFFDAEHFFDGYKRNPEYALNCLLAAERGGAEVLVLCDTNGGTMPHEIGDIIDTIKPQLKTELGIHAHNDCELAVANSLIAVRHGASHVQGTVNGYGERCGNANLISIIPSLKLKFGIDCHIEDAQLARLSKLSHHVAEIANMTHNANQAYVGQNAFAHKGGVHVSAIMKNPETYEHIRPEQVGNKQEVTVSDQSGMSNLLYKAEKFGITVDAKDVRLKDLVQRTKELDKLGFTFEEAEASFELLMRRKLELFDRSFQLEGFRVIDEKRGHDEEVIVEATVKVSVEDNIYHTAAEGEGPIDALNNALRKVLDRHYPEVSSIILTDYKVRVLNSEKGTSSMVRVLIESSDGKKSWGTVGVSPNLIEATWKALIDSIEYKLLKG
ncbi:citramalate synthase [Persicirhabdus sediminis]|uniref:Citramalate synthase n=1 Tax=Persicirhabdus sediminis TaxID=454144 RepID=A0A8J7MFN2_9BACT|nr:citramalate synthase [Persicirhabdus sediminis]MBK1791915.1 citramalate synthase [Persicirhabdus sediminis]